MKFYLWNNDHFPNMLPILLFLIPAVLSVERIHDDYKNHACKRDCRFGGRKTCKYELTLDLALSNQFDCLGCLNGTYEDCFKPHCIPIDGNHRTVNVYNGLLPGPSIEVCQGDEVIVDFTNNLMDVSSTIHWHGMHQKNTQFMDGIPFLTQCPVHAHNSFQYKFIASESGTHWYHSHSGIQRINGAFGALIVREVRPFHKKLYDYDLSEHVITITDWHKNYPMQDFMQITRQYVFLGEIISGILINSLASLETNSIPQMRFEVNKGFRYRFRLIHTGSYVCPITVSIENHRFHVISTDGFDLVATLADSVTLTNAERIDIIVKTDQPIDTYAIKFTGSDKCPYTTIASLIYNGSNITKVPYNKPDNVINKKHVGLDDMKSIVPLDAAFKRRPDIQHYVVLDFEPFVRPSLQALGHEIGLTPFINDILYTPPPTPLLLNQNPDNVCNANDRSVCDPNLPLCECMHMLELPFNKLIELVFVNEGIPINDNHPMHLHGYNFRVMAHGKFGSNITADYVKQLDAAGSIARNFDSPPVKDTVSVEDGGFVIVRFISDNPGYWLLHCHVDFHQEEGMQMVFKTGNFSGQLPPNFPTCGNFPSIQ